LKKDARDGYLHHMGSCNRSKMNRPSIIIICGINEISLW